MNKIKQMGQVMTPITIARHMIKQLCLTSEEIKTKLFLEPSCGTGVFIQELIGVGVPKEHIYACEIDSELAKKSQSLLPQENFYLGSAFDKKDWYNKFDYVIGNPPYVRIHNIPEKDRIYYKQNFSFYKGMSDLYILFYELGLKFLNSGGTLLYITPNSFYKNKSGELLCEHIQQNNLLFYFEDFEHSQNFNNYSTYTCIMGLSYTKPCIKIPWEKEHIKIGLPYTTIQNGIATNCDSFFIQKDFSFIEPNLVHPILKASTLEELYVIVPPQTEDELKQYPKTYKYFCDNKDMLEKRNLQGQQWFQFARTQGLQNMHNPKIAIPTIIKENGLKVKKLSSEWYVYSGLYATSNDLDLLEQELTSSQLLDYIKSNGKPMSGDFYQITSTLLKNY